MKDVLANSIDRYRQSLIVYLTDAQKAFSENPDDSPTADEVMEFLIEKIESTQPGKSFKFSYRDFGM
ncbi:MAG: hypothetical protein WC284_14455 [Candidimonas sp.]